jgi:hypothetical protein
MLRFRGHSDDGRILLGFGLSDGNLEKLRERKPIHVKLETMGVAGIDVLICWGPTEQAIADDIQRHQAQKIPTVGEDEMPPVFGPTGDFPLGKLNDTDEGGLAFRVRHEKNRVILDFGKSTRWLGLDKATALELANRIRTRANEIDVAVPPEPE